MPAAVRAEVTNSGVGAPALAAALVRARLTSSPATLAMMMRSVAVGLVPTLADRRGVVVPTSTAAERRAVVVPASIAAERRAVVAPASTAVERRAVVGPASTAAERRAVVGRGDCQVLPMTWRR